jgi:hypothetical protein
VDSDGNRVQATENGTLTKFDGSHYEETGSQITSTHHGVIDNLSNSCIIAIMNL